jgi:hypothetical protein
MLKFANPCIQVHDHARLQEAIGKIEDYVNNATRVSNWPSVSKKERKNYQTRY